MSNMILTPAEKNKLAKQYEALVNKIVAQFAHKVAASWDDLKSMAYEGFANAINNYDDERSSMNFTQFAAFAIRNNILTCLDNELRTVKMSNYIQKKATEEGNPLYNTVRFDMNVREDDDKKAPREVKYGLFEDEKFSDGDTFEFMYSALEAKFSARDCNIFYMTFGLKEYEEVKCKDIASQMGLSIGSVSIINKKIITHIRSNSELCEMLAKL